MNSTNIINRIYKLFFKKDITKVYEIIGTTIFLLIWLSISLFFTKIIYDYTIDPNLINKIITDFKTNNSHFILSTYAKYNVKSDQIISILSIFFIQILLNMIVCSVIYGAWLVFGYPVFNFIRNYVNKELSISNNTFGFKLKPFFNDTYIFLLNIPVLIVLTYISIIFLPSYIIIKIFEKITDILIIPIYKKLKPYIQKLETTILTSKKKTNPSSTPSQTKTYPWYYSFLFFLNLSLFFTFTYSLNDTPKTPFSSYFDERLVFNAIFFILFINIICHKQLKKIQLIQAIYIAILFYTYNFNAIQYQNGLISLCIFALPFTLLYYINHKFNLKNRISNWIKNQSNKNVKVKYNIAKDILDQIKKNK